jgi:hypothetical protein
LGETFAQQLKPFKISPDTISRQIINDAANLLGVEGCVKFLELSRLRLLGPRFCPMVVPKILFERHFILVARPYPSTAKLVLI